MSIHEQSIGGDGAPGRRRDHPSGRSRGAGGPAGSGESSPSASSAPRCRGTRSPRASTTSPTAWTGEGRLSRSGGASGATPLRPKRSGDRGRCRVWVTRRCECLVVPGHTPSGPKSPGVCRQPAPRAGDQGPTTRPSRSGSTDRATARSRPRSASALSPAPARGGRPERRHRSPAATDRRPTQPRHGRHPPRRRASSSAGASGNNGVRAGWWRRSSPAADTSARRVRQAGYEQAHPAEVVDGRR